MGLISFRRIKLLPSALFMLVLFTSITAIADEHVEEGGSVDIVWPASPQEPRIRYIRSIATSEDMATEKGFFGKLLEFIIGPDDVVDLVKPMGLAVNSAGKMFVADPAGKRVHIFDTLGQEYASIEEVNDRLFVLPIEVSVDNQDNLYVVDGGLRKVFKFNSDGEFVTAFGDESLQRPTGISIDSEKKLLYVVDTPAHNVKAYSLENGALVATLGERGTEDGTFNFPSYATIDAKGSLYITDSMNKKVRVFGADREYQRAVGKPGDGSGSFSAPKGVAVDSDGNLYVADVAFDNVQMFDAEGRLLMAFGSPGQEPGKFWMPTGLFIDESDRIYVADSYNKRVQIFQYLDAAKK